MFTETLTKPLSKALLETTSNVAFIPAVITPLLEALKCSCPTAVLQTLAYYVEAVANLFDLLSGDYKHKSGKTWAGPPFDCPRAKLNICPPQISPAQPQTPDHRRLFDLPSIKQRKCIHQFSKIRLRPGFLRIDNRRNHLNSRENTCSRSVVVGIPFRQWKRSVIRVSGTRQLRRQLQPPFHKC